MWATRLFPQPLFSRRLIRRFHKHSRDRGSIKFRGMSQVPRADQPARFLFKLRSLSEIQARAAILAVC